MPNENPKQIEKPWAVYSFSHYEGRNASGIGKVTNLIDFAIRYSEGQRYPASLWNPRYVKAFRTSAEALDYFFENYQEKNITKQKAQERFLENFPSERTNLENLFAQTLPKCTPTVEEDWGPFGKHPNLKDGPIGPHPNIKY